MRLHLHFALLLVGLLVGLAEAQNSSNSLGIMGAVQDTSGAVIAGAEVALDRVDGSELTRTVTDRTGGFQFKNLPPGSYLVDVQQPGFREVKVSARADVATHPPLALCCRSPPRRRKCLSEHRRAPIK
jgi:Carboxypeptidase regulatory-like domain